MYVYIYMHMQNLQKHTKAKLSKKWQTLPGGSLREHCFKLLGSIMSHVYNMHNISLSLSLSLSKNLSVWMDVYAWWQNGVVFQQRQVACRKCKRSKLDGWMMALVFWFGEKMTWIYRISWLKDKTFRRISHLPLAWLILLHRYFLRWIAMKNATKQLSNAHSIFNILPLPWGKGFNMFWCVLINNIHVAPKQPTCTTESQVKGGQAQAAGMRWDCFI